MTKRKPKLVDAPKLEHVNFEAEEGLVASALIADYLLEDPEIASIRPSHFHDRRLGTVWKAILDLKAGRSNVDIVTVSEILEKRKKLDEIGGRAYLTEITTNVPSTVHAQSYARIVKSNAARRALLNQLAPSIAKKTGSAESVYDVFRDIKEQLRDLENGYASGDGMRPITWKDQVEAMPTIEWMWKPWLPIGHVTEVVGAPEIGKSAFVLMLARSIINLSPWPDGTLPKTKLKGLVVWYDTENAETINHQRSIWFGIDHEKVLVPSRHHDPFADVSLLDPDGWMSFETAVGTEGVKLAVIDSLGGSFHRENDPEVGALIQRIGALARDLQIAVVIVHHPTKLRIGQLDTLTLERVRGHSKIIQFARSIIAVEKPDAANENVRIKQIKMNMARKADPIGMSWTQDPVKGDPDRAYIVFGDAPIDRPKTTKQDEAVEWLRILLKDEPRWSQEVIEELEAKGISKATVRLARENLRIVTKKNPDDKNRSYWSLPGRPEGS